MDLFYAIKKEHMFKLIYLSTAGVFIGTNALNEAPPYYSRQNITQ